MQVILLSYPGVSGEATIAGYADMVACASLEMSTVDSDASLAPPSLGDKPRQSHFEDDNSPGLRQGAGGGAKTQKGVGLDSLTLTKSVDQATPKFLEKAFSKKTETDKATIIVLRAFEQALSDLQSDISGIAGASAPSVGGAQTPSFWHKQFLKISLQDVNISYHQISVSESDATETIKISFKKLSMEYTVFKNGIKAGSTTGAVDLTQKS